MTPYLSQKRILPWVCFSMTLLGAATFSGTALLLRTSCWLLIEIAIALTISGALALGATLFARPQLLTYINQVVSRGLELAAALPAVLACGVLVRVAGLPVPTSIACVVGILGGLHCVRSVALAAPLERIESTQRSGRTAHFLILRRSVSPVFSTVVEQVVGLEAAVAWLELFDRDWAGGWGAQLGQAARHGDPRGMLIWTMLTVCLSVALKRIASQQPEMEPGVTYNATSS